MAVPALPHALDDVAELQDTGLIETAEVKRIEDNRPADIDYDEDEA